MHVAAPQAEMSEPLPKDQAKEVLQIHQEASYLQGVAVAETRACAMPQVSVPRKTVVAMKEASHQGVAG